MFIQQSPDCLRTCRRVLLLASPEVEPSQQRAVHPQSYRYIVSHLRRPTIRFYHRYIDIIGASGNMKEPELLSYLREQFARLHCRLDELSRWTTEADQRFGAIETMLATVTLGGTGK